MKYKQVEGSSATLYRKLLAAFFTALLSACTVLGAIPITIDTPVGTVSAEVNEAEARNRNTSANRPRSARVTNTGARLHQNFSANRTSYRVEVRESTTHANIRLGLRAGQQTRFRIDTRNQNGNWVNGSYNSWRTRTTSNIDRDFRVNVSQGVERRLRVQIRDNNGNRRTITFNVQRASGNTWGANLTHNAGTLNRSFTRATTNYTLTIPHNRTATTQVGMRAEQERAHTRHRVRMQNANGVWGSWSAWSTYGRGQQNRNVGTIPQGRNAEVQFMVRGAWTNRNNTTLRTRTYTVTVHRPVQNVQTFTVTFNSQGGSAVPSMTVQSGQPIGQFPPRPTKPGHSFAGWFTAVTGGTQVTVNTIVTSNMTLHARWVHTAPIQNPGGWTTLAQSTWLEYHVANQEFRMTGMQRYDQARIVFDLVNGRRAEVGLPPLIYNQQLADAAMQRSADMAVAWGFGHARPDGSDWTALVQNGSLPQSAGNPWRIVRENLAGNGFNAQGAFNAWRTSPGHDGTMRSVPGTFDPSGSRMYGAVGAVEFPGVGTYWVLIVASTHFDVNNNGFQNAPWPTNSTRSFTARISNPQSPHFGHYAIQLLAAAGVR